MNGQEGDAPAPAPELTERIEVEERSEAEFNDPRDDEDLDTWADVDPPTTESADGGPPKIGARPVKWDPGEGCGIEPGGGFSFRLQFPVEHGSAMLEKLVFRAPKGKDFNTCPTNFETWGQVQRFGARLVVPGPLPAAVVNRLVGPDAVHFNEVALYLFLGTPEQIGSGFQAS